jgi:hypothetical protein
VHPLPESAEPVDPALPFLGAEVERDRPRPSLAALAAAVIALALAIPIALSYPLAPGLLMAALMLYGGALWRWPQAWLFVIPAVLPAFDLAPWTGWLFVAEPDLFILVTIAVLAIRAPPQRADFWIAGWPGAALALAVIALLSSVALGLALPGPAGGSDNAYLRPDNALRLAKGLFLALALLPFLARSLRMKGEALGVLGAGMVGGLALVAAATMFERAIFTGPFNFTIPYRVVATFSSMHLGGGYIGAYVAMALPFLFALLMRSRGAGLAIAAAIAVGAIYTLIVTFARAAYASGVLAGLVFVVAWAWAMHRRRAGVIATLVAPAALLLVLAGIVLATAIDSKFMALRVGMVTQDLGTRERNWSSGLALRDKGIVADLIGMGLGTYPRIVLARRPNGNYQTNFVLERDGNFRYLALSAGLPLYFGQKVAADRRQSYILSLTLRSPDGKGQFTALLCEKLLLYSANCRRLEFRPKSPGRWERVGGLFPGIPGDAPSRFKFLARPQDLAFVDRFPGTRFEIGEIRLIDAAGRNLIANGDFSSGLARWFFTDDNHSIWRIENQYLMTLFEGGVLGLAAFILFAAAALAGACRAVGSGEPAAAAVAASLAAFLWSCFFDCLLDVPRLATLFYLLAFAGIILLRAPQATRAWRSHSPSP